MGKFYIYLMIPSRFLHHLQSIKLQLKNEIYNRRPVFQGLSLYIEFPSLNARYFKILPTKEKEPRKKLRGDIKKWNLQNPNMPLNAAYAVIQISYFFMNC